jgi:hypothetical protein
MAAGVAAILIAGTPAVRAADDDIVPWKTVGDWQIAVNKALGYGCFMGTGYSRGTVLLLGFNGKTGSGYIIAGNTAWRSLEEGKEYPLKFEFNDGTSWRGTATGMGNPVFLYLPVDKPNFVIDFAKKLWVSISTTGRDVTQLTLTGTYAAVQELVVCQRAISRARDNDDTDPFR